MINSVYFVGAGGIGMSALVRYFLLQGIKVAGYDRTVSKLTEDLCREGADIHYEDNPNLIPQYCRNKKETLVVFTPAISTENKELTFFRKEGFTIRKRAEVLGLLTQSLKGLCVAGTHGKTTTTSMLAHILHESHVKCNAFLGGIAKNYDTNYLFSRESPYVVIEADEYDRSFLHLHPFATVITATDADHLDIYGTEGSYLEGFSNYTTLIQSGGTLIIHRDLKMKENLSNGVKKYDYSRSEGDFHAENIRIGEGHIIFDFVSPFENIKDVELGVPISINIENGIAAMALAQIAGASSDEIRNAMQSFKGVVRRFDFCLRNNHHVLLNDYAHHPAEIKQSILSIREVFNGRKLTGIFQPHLYTRTRDFYNEFAESLSLLDEVILTEIYPAREEPIKGVSSKLIYDKLQPSIEKHLIKKTDLINFIATEDTDVIMVLGAGDIVDYIPQIKELLERK